MTDVDVAVDLCNIVRWPADVVLDQTPPLEHGHLCHPWAGLHAHEIAPDRLAVALTPSALFEPRFVQLLRAALSRDRRDRRDSSCAGHRPVYRLA